MRKAATDKMARAINRTIIPHLRSPSLFPGKGAFGLMGRANRALTGGDIGISLSGTDRKFDEAMAAITKFRITIQRQPPPPRKASIGTDRERFRCRHCKMKARSLSGLLRRQAKKMGLCSGPDNHTPVGVICVLGRFDGGRWLRGCASAVPWRLHADVARSGGACRSRHHPCHYDQCHCAVDVEEEAAVGPLPPHSSR